MKKFLSKCKYAVLGLGASLCGGAYAEGEAASSFDTSVADAFLTRAESTITTFWSTNQSTILSVLGIIIGLAVLWMVVKIILKATRKAG